MYDPFYIVDLLLFKNGQVKYTVLGLHKNREEAKNQRLGIFQLL